MYQSSLVSIIIPCYNTEQFIAEAIDSALNQTYPNIEVIVIDDGSTDRSVEIIQSYKDRIYFEVIDHQGACAARNRGLAISQGEFIQFLDADDRLVSTKLERQIPYLLSGEADLVFCKGFIFGDERPMRPKKSQIKSPVGVDPFVYCLNQGLSTEGPLHRRNKLIRVNGFTEGLPRAQEYDLHIRLGATGIKILLLDDLLYEHRNHNCDMRITRTKLPQDYLLNLFLKLEQVLIRENPYNMTDLRIKALAGKIFKHSIYAFRNGSEASAKEGFSIAKSLTNQPIYDERSWYKLLTNLIDPLMVERLLKQGRSYRDFLLKY